MAKHVEVKQPSAEWNRTRTDYPRHKTIHGLFEEQADTRADSPAISFLNRALTYQQLNNKANEVADCLQRLGIGRGHLVGICTRRCPEMIAGLLGILKAGAAFVPLDPNYPDDRLAFMLQDAGMAYVVIHRDTADRLAPYLGQASLVRIDTEMRLADRSAGGNTASGATADDLAYVMYTSGSTGKPKGVMIGHRAVVRLVRNTNYCNFDKDQVFLQLAPISFDPSTLEIWGALLNGAGLAIMPPETPTLVGLGEAIRRHGVTTLIITTGFFNLMVEQRIEDLRSLRQIFVGGDVISPKHVLKALDELHDGTVTNLYGPTESTTNASFFPMSKGYCAGDTIPIGRPISNTTLYVLDENLQSLPIGESGELCIGGDGLAHGYLNNPELTSRKFVPDPFSSEPGARLYRTGDQARYLPDGNIEFLGRLDHQVKISGYRIELGEIEATLRQHPLVQQIVVVAGMDAQRGKTLVAYVVGSNPGPLAAEELKGYLAERLPAFMIPSRFVQLESLPLSSHGKLDRSALPPPHRPMSENTSARPVFTDLEARIAELWKGVLGSEVGPDDNFFDLGGDSLRLTKVHAEMQRAFSREISITELFEFTTIRSLARHLSGTVSADLKIARLQERARRQRESVARQRMLREHSL